MLGRRKFLQSLLALTGVLIVNPLGLFKEQIDKKVTQQNPTHYPSYFPPQYYIDQRGFFLLSSSVPKYCIPTDGRALSKTEHDKLFQAISYTYGGDGDNFYVPDLRGRILYSSQE